MIVITGRLRSKFGGTLEDFEVSEEVASNIPGNWTFISKIPNMPKEIIDRYSMLLKGIQKNKEEKMEKLTISSDELDFIFQCLVICEKQEENLSDKYKEEGNIKLERSTGRKSWLLRRLFRRIGDLQIRMYSTDKQGIIEVIKSSTEHIT